MSGGSAHDLNWKGYENIDADGNFLKKIVGQKDYEFYTGLTK